MEEFLKKEKITLYVKNIKDPIQLLDDVIRRLKSLKLKARALGLTLCKSFQEQQAIILHTCCNNQRFQCSNNCNKMPRSRWHLSRSNPATDRLHLDVGRNRHNHFCQPFVPTLQQTRNTPETGLPAIDYRIFDSLADPPETKQKHVEELV